MKLLERIFGREGASAPRPSANAGYLRDSRSRILSTRGTALRDHRDEVRTAWRRAAGLAMDIIQNSGRLRGAVDQVIADTVGVELILNPMPDLAKLGYDRKETDDFIKLLKAEWKRWAWNARECDLKGKFIVPQKVDIALRHDVVFGEALMLMDYMSAGDRRRYGITSGTKMCLTTPTALVQDTSEFEGLYQGVIHDPNGRPVAYRLAEKETGIVVKRDHRAYDAQGRQMVAHVFDPVDGNDVRGISRLVAAFREYLQWETLVDVTIQTGILQTVFAQVLTSEKPSAEAFEALEALGESQDGKELRAQFRDYFLAVMDKAAESEISVGSDPKISHLAPGEKLDLMSTGIPGPQFLPVSNELQRGMARAIGISVASYTMNYEGATYSSTRMEGASLHPVVTRRRDRIASPICQIGFEHLVDELIGTGRLPFKGGYEAFSANRDRVLWAMWQGPAKATADDQKSAKAASERLLNGTSTLDMECAEIGADAEEVFERRLYWHKRYVEAGMPSPFARSQGSGDAKDDVIQDEKASKKKEDA
ncbi:phage portal protein [Mesorhizobium sp. P16.1]|uniref:phage portal protein n=2 Tax=Mesorhizobium TaxID=68287 RepID=UPI0019D2DE77|nr:MULTISPECIES: phage portal protein [unclassified Mesorhizobium]MCT2579136.1 phage portal protein [Mesorhizobium sp. P13.3]MDF3168075.1 phage portal protein [Mesorhizobium sp. P16.1]MDF3180017.1 phage portal protein [Mesorhizobium sp. P17.1]MDF3184989.1 phage portal protein [Mesorhizobium sp. ICCV3110.1]